MRKNNFKKSILWIALLMLCLATASCDQAAGPSVTDGSTADTSYTEMTDSLPTETETKEISAVTEITTDLPETETETDDSSSDTEQPNESSDTDEIPVFTYIEGELHTIDPQIGIEFVNQLQAQLSEHNTAKYIWDTGTDRLTFTYCLNGDDSYILKMNDHVVALGEHPWPISSIVVSRSIFAVVTQCEEQYPFYVFDYDCNLLFQTMYVNNKGMALQDPSCLKISNDVLIMKCSRARDQYLSMVSDRGENEFSAYRDMLYQDIEYDYSHLDIPSDKIFLHQSNWEQLKNLNPEEIVQAFFSMKYLGQGVFDAMSISSDYTTLNTFYLEGSEPPLRFYDLKKTVPDFLNEEQQHLFRLANQIYPAFRGNSDMLDNYPRTDDAFSSETPSPDVFLNEDGPIPYYYSTDGRYQLWDDFWSMGTSIFTEAYFSELSEHFLEKDGRTYIPDVAKGGAWGYISEKDEYRLLSMTESEIQFELTSYYEDIWISEGQYGESSKNFTFVLTLTEEGWRFSRFSSPLFDE